MALQEAALLITLLLDRTVRQMKLDAIACTTHFLDLLLDETYFITTTSRILQLFIHVLYL